MTDAIGSTETGMNGIRIVQKGDAPKEGITTVHGVGRHGRARRRPATRSSPARARSAGSRAAATSRSATTTTREDRGDVRHRRATASAGRSPATTRRVEADGRITLLGRGSVSINSGGEKIYPEEVEGALKSHPDVFDVLVVGVPDESTVDEPSRARLPLPVARQRLHRTRRIGSSSDARSRCSTTRAWPTLQFDSVPPPLTAAPFLGAPSRGQRRRTRGRPDSRTHAIAVLPSVRPARLRRSLLDRLLDDFRVRPPARAPAGLRPPCGARTVRIEARAPTAPPTSSDRRLTLDPRGAFGAYTATSAARPRYARHENEISTLHRSLPTPWTQTDDDSREFTFRIRKM